MFLVNSWNIPVVDCWEPYAHGVFWDQPDETIFLYWDALRSVNAFSPLVAESKKLCFIPREYKVTLPREWRVINDYLFLSEYTGIDLRRMQFYTSHTDEQCRAYRCAQLPEKHLEEGVYHFGEYTIRHKGEWGYICNVADQPVWEFSGRGYLYTKISRHQDSLFFSTAGHGGYFYLLDIHTGKPILNINTGGTAAIVEKSGLCYFLGKKPQPQLYCVDLDKGCIRETLSLPGSPERHSVLHIWKDKLYATTFEYKNRIPVQVLLHEFQRDNRPILSSP